MRTYVGDPHHCYCVTVLFYDLVVPLMLIRHINKDCYYRHFFFNVERAYGRLNIATVGPLVSISEWWWKSMCWPPGKTSVLKCGEKGMRVWSNSEVMAQAWSFWISVLLSHCKESLFIFLLCFAFIHPFLLSTKKSFLILDGFWVTVS